MAVVVALSTGGCGRKATAEDCERIVKRIAELHLESVVPEGQLAARVRETQEEFRERALSDCVGKRISDTSLECLTQAKTAEGAIDRCFD